jgi:hypothetical protein
MRFLQLCSAIENKVSHCGRMHFPFSSPQSQHLWGLKKKNAYFGRLFSLLNLAKILEVTRVSSLLKDSKAINNLIP